MTTHLHERLNSVRPERIQRYLTHSGWVESPFARNDVVKFIAPANPSIFVLISKSNTVPDYVDSLCRAVRTISQFEGRDSANVVANIVSPNVDRLRFRFSGSVGEDGTLPLDYAIKVTEHIRQALVFAACGELNPQASYRRALKPALDVVRKSRFGQTMFGSYIISVDVPHSAPVPISGSHAESPQQDALERRVIARVLRGVSRARAVAIQGERLDVSNEFKLGLNANLSDALAALNIEGTDIAVGVSALWDQSVPSFGDLPTEPVLLERTTFESLGSIANALRGELRAREVNTKAHIVQLSRKEEPEVILKVIKPEEDLPQSIHARVSLEDYTKACDAHRDHKPVLVNGRLERLSEKQWWLTGPNVLCFDPE